MLTDLAIEKHGLSDELVVLMHAYASTRASLRGVADAVLSSHPNADVLVPQYPSGILANEDPCELAEELVDAIDYAVGERKRHTGTYQNIILVGHSLGALLVRKAYVYARGKASDSSASFLPAERAWAHRVSRIILFAGMNRGWSLRPRPSHMTPLRQYATLIAVALAVAVRQGRLIRSIRKGSPFIVNLRAQWINLMRSADTDLPPTIQLLGTIDELVSEQDHIDLQSGINFIYRRVPNTNHKNVVDFTDSEARRLAAFKYALDTPQDGLESQYVIPLKQKLDRSVEHIVFVMHGIRDQGFWPAELEKEIQTQADQVGVKVVVITSGYGYFPMLPFLFRFRRQRNVRWFMDQYTEALARYPRAKFSFVGHSNGTYLLASALEHYQVSKFYRAVFAGSVVRRNFPWDQMVREERLVALKNYIASKDWVVAWFPEFLERFLNSDVGSGGYDGFTDDEGQQHAVTFIKGSHGAAVTRATFPAVARFVLTGEDSDNAALLVGERSNFVSILSRFCWAIWLGLGALLATGGFFVIPRAAASLANLGLPYAPAVSTLIYLALVGLLMFSF